MDGSAVPTPKTRESRIAFRRLALPSEHGSWSILLEPLVAGLAVAPSPAGPFVALLFVSGFLAHQPLRICLTALRNKRRMPHTPVAAILAVVFVTFTLVGLIGTWEVAGTDSLAPLLAAAPLAVLQLGYDQIGKSRRLIPELAGAVALSSSAAITAHAGGWSATAALALWCVFGSRSIASLVYVRNRLLLGKGKASSTIVPIAVHAAALAAVVMLAVAGLSPKLAIPAFLMLLARAAIGLSPCRLKLHAMQIGVLEVIFGTLTVLAVVFGHYLHF